MPSSTSPRTTIAASTPYPIEAFAFVRDALEHTSNSVHGPDASEATRLSRHVSGAQLCEGIREYAVQQFGRLAPTVLRRWNIHRTDDFGAIVYAMIEAGFLRKTDEDSIEHFRGVFDFAEAFRDANLC